MDRSRSERGGMHLGVMGSFSIWHWAIVLVVVILLFGRNRISTVMGDFAKGIKSFKKGLADEETAAVPPPAAPAAGPAVAAAPIDRPPAA